MTVAARSRPRIAGSPVVPVQSCGFGLQGAVLTPALSRVLTETARSTPTAVAERIQAEVREYAGPAYGRRRVVIRQAVDAAVGDFVALLVGDGSGHAAVDRLFRELARAEAESGRPVTALLSALRVAKSELWRELSRLAVRHDLSGRVVAAVGAGVDGYLSHLSSQVERGYLVPAGCDPDPSQRLLHALVSGGPGLEVLAEHAGWAMPERVVVLLSRATEPSTPSDAPAGVLVGRNRSHVLAISGEGDLPSAQAFMLTTRCAPAAVTWPVACELTCEAVRWAAKTLELHRVGRIRVDGPWIDCRAHRVSLLLDSDIALQRGLVEEVLTPLATLTPHKRQVLARTLHRWLTTNESAPELSRNLGHHPQTTRNHLRKLRELFGPALEDPKQRISLIIALEAGLPE